MSICKVKDLDLLICENLSFKDLDIFSRVNKYYYNLLDNKYWKRKTLTTFKLYPNLQYLIDKGLFKENQKDNWKLYYSELMCVESVVGKCFFQDGGYDSYYLNQYLEEYVLQNQFNLFLLILLLSCMYITI